MQAINKPFKCTNCGYCCRTLFGFSNGWLKGLGLIKQETSLFDQRYIFPQSAIGRDGPEHVFIYQLGLAACPYIQADDKCTIYEKRPMICRCYPFEMVGFGENLKKNIVLTPECSAIKGINGISEDDVPKECEEMHLYFRTEFKVHGKKGAHFWDFDLATKSWKLRK